MPEEVVSVNDEVNSCLESAANVAFISGGGDEDRDALTDISEEATFEEGDDDGREMDNEVENWIEG